MGDTSGGTRLAAEIGTGTGGALVVFALILASVALFTFLSGSLRRMRANVASGEFGSEARERGRAAAEDSAPASEPAAGSAAVSSAAAGGAAAGGTATGAEKDPDPA
ncbi:hypothetical protein MXD62_02185 [Frankia sp. Mgl5]|uniref:hypothetical protein n=1 Tax=Frankia sp. Mgl5 TaxID=2933793 RepID=UPI00200F00ED|nr:hypothetical protein [Frankia sp. Mgl5]MCK9925981.1 hypothetical protein [Frankia sp. Mgl5]